ncbi:MAG TPA: C4-type zinc ribbon domain-containing protein [Labilithrix sp.]|jgi:hypothetical protein|nr:C4-type zinc ribbon domain-containing protein [Labilithrix sp.]
MENESSKPPLEPARLLRELVRTDAEVEQLRQELEVLRGCTEAGLRCVRASQAVFQALSSWRESSSQALAGRLIEAESAEQVARATAVTEQRVSELLDLYAECARPLQAALESQTSNLIAAEARRNALTKGLPGGLATRHEVLRTTTKYPYICQVISRRCKGCNMLLPTALAQTVARGQTDSCPSCRRILFVG